MREPRRRQQAAAAARNNVAPAARSTNLMDMPLDEFQGALAELAQQGVDTDALLRQYRSANSPFAAVNRAAEGASADLTAAGRRPVAGSAGFLSRPVDGAGGVGLNLGGGLLGMLAGAGQAIDAPMAAYQELIPSEDMNLEALGTGSMAMLGGGAMTRPANSVGMGGRVARSAGAFDDIKAAFPDVKLNIGGTPESGFTLSRIVVPEEIRGSGVGTEIMNAITRRADELGGQINLTPSADFGGNVKRLRDFYGRQGFVQNKGRNRDFSTQEGMYRTARANRDQTTGLLGTMAAAEPRNTAERIARDILDMRAAGRAGEVTDDMMAQADPQYMFANTPLPMDEASRLARAGEAGFTTGRDRQDVMRELRGLDNPQLVHYTNQDFNEFRIPERENRQAIWATPDPNANLATKDNWRSFDEEGVNGIPIMARMSQRVSPYQFRMAGDPMTPGFPRNVTAEDVAKANSVGADYAEAGLEYAILDPTNIRSRFARFDPEFSHLSNLNAANIDPMSGLFGAMAAEEQRRQRNAP